MSNSGSTSLSKEAIPSASALSKLSDKIKSKLNKESEQNDKKHKSTKTNGKKDSKKANGTPSKESKKDHTNTSKSPKKDHKTSIKSSKNKSAKDKTQSVKDQQDDEEEENILLREIKNFGGSAADLDLVGDLDSDSESVVDFDNDSSNKKGASDKSLASDVFKFMNELGLEGSGTDFVIKDDDEDAMEPEPKPKKEKKDSKKDDKKADTKEAKKDTKKDAKESKALKDVKEVDSKKTKESKKESKKEAEMEERKKQFTSSTANEIDQIMNEINPLEQGETVFNSRHTKNQLILVPRSDWYNHELDEPEPNGNELSDVLIERLYTKAKNMLSKENELFTHENNKSNSQKQFLSQLLTAGTLSDKIGAYSLLIQESPLHSVKYLTSLLGLCRKKSRGSALQSIAALKDIFVQGGVLPDRKLRWFKNQPGLSSFASPELLIVWAFEDWLKQYFFSLIQILEVLSHDTVPYVRSSTVLHILELLKSKPEQEANLLRLGVNKLGDSDKKVASRVSYLLLQIQQAHPAMKSIVVDAISELLFRPGSDYHSRYYSIITLNQTILAHKEIHVSNTLMKTYLSLFERLLAEWTNEKQVPEAAEVKKKKPRWKNKGNKGKNGGERQAAKTSDTVREEENSKLTSAILTGMNRAYPFSELPEDLLLSHINTLYRVTHSANFNTSVQALILLFQISQKDKNLSDRFYRTLYESLLDPRLSVSSKLRLYLNLLFKAVKQDTNIERAKAFAKRMVQIANHWLNVGVVAGVIYLLIELSKTTPRIRELLITMEKSEEVEDNYDGKKRDPLFANADNTKLWEILPLLNHFHPTVELYARHLTGQAPITSTKLGQPDLTLHGLTHFLDRFVYRNPKQKSSSHGSSIMQPLAGSDPTGLVIGANKSRNIKPINSSDWANMKIENVDVGERFFYNYFTLKNQQKKAPKQESQDFDEDGDNLNEDAVWKALVRSNADIENDEESDLDMDDFSDMEDMDEEEEDLDEDEEEEEEDVDEKDNGESDDDIGLDDEEGVLGSDDEVDIAVGDEDENEEELEALFAKELEKASTGKRSRSDESEEEEEASVTQKKKKSTKQKLKDLPVFASAEDYAQYLGSSDDEDYS